MSDKHLSKTRFDSFPFSAAIMAGIRDAGFEYCTPIQAQTLPIALDGRDVAGQAQTGTGKTAAFLLTILHTLDQEPAELSRRPNQPRALVLAPTRELAVQIYNDACVLAAHTGLKVRVVYGGTGYDTQRKAIEEGVDILIGTPGRIIDYFKQHVFDLRAVQTLVLDEADRMFDLGFHQGHPFPAAPMPHTGKPPGHAVLGNPVLPGHRTRLRAHEQPGKDRGRGRTDHG